MVAPTVRYIFVVLITGGSSIYNRSYLGSSRKITVKAKIPIEYPLSIVGTGVLDCPMS